MRTLKARGGLTRGRGMTEAVYLQWIHTVHKNAEIHEAMSELLDHNYQTSEQHQELGKSRINRDNTDLETVIAWFSKYNPFYPVDPNLRCLHVGISPIEGKDNINCEQVESKGAIAQTKVDNLEYSNASLSRKDMVITLANLQQGVKVGEQSIVVDDDRLFNRLIAIADRSNDVEPYFEYELTNTPTSLFKDGFMRKPNKSALMHAITKHISQSDDISHRSFVLDGGALLHRVKWQASSTYQYAVSQYCKYIQAKYGTQCTIVFDGYENDGNIKDHEHLRRSRVISPFINLKADMQVDTNQQQFLSNKEKKTQFITLLSDSLSACGHCVIQSKGDADTLIVKAALDLATSKKTTTVIADDTDILILLLHHYRTAMSDIFLVSERSSSRYNIRELIEQMHPIVLKHILFIHALGGCDSTSAIFGKGKTSILLKLQSSAEIQLLSCVFEDYSSSQLQISQAGIRIFVIIYGGSENETLNRLRYVSYMNMLTKSFAAIQPAKLPPTESAAMYHCFRVHFQILQWDSFMETSVKSTDWGWRKNDNSLVPIMTDKDPAPIDLLKFIRCNCKLTTKNPCSSNICTCRKHGLSCMTACGNCHGQNCTNIKVTQPELQSIDSEDDESRNAFDLFS